MRTLIEKKYTETATFRIEKDVLEKLRVDAKIDKITLNAYVNQILGEFLEWYAPAKKASMIPLPKILLVKIMNKLTEEEVLKIAEHMVTKEIKDIILILKKEHNLSAFLDTIESWAKTSNFPISHEQQNSSNHKYVITHEMGKNWSLYFGVLFTRMFEELGVSHVNFEITDKTLNFNFSYLHK